MNGKWILAASLAFGSASVVFVTPQVAAAKEPKEYDEQVKYADLPKAVKATVDKERGQHEVLAYYHVMREGKEFYRAVIDTKGADTIVRVQPGGNLLTEQEAKDANPPIAKHHTGAAEGSKREVHLAANETGGEIVDYDRLPGQVKTEIGHLAKADKVEQVVRYQHRGHTMYRADVGEGKYKRYIRVSEEGKVEGVRGDIDPGEVVPFDRTPGAVKTKIGSLAKSGKVDEVIEYKRGGKTYYQAEVDEKGGNRSYFYTVDAEGREVEGLPHVQ